MSFMIEQGMCRTKQGSAEELRLSMRRLEHGISVNFKPDWGC